MLDLHLHKPALRYRTEQHFHSFQWLSILARAVTPTCLARSPTSVWGAVFCLCYLTWRRPADTLVWSKKSFSQISQNSQNLLDRRGLLEMFFQLFDPHAEEHQEDTFCYIPVALCELTVWLIIYHTVYLESLETPGQPEPDHGAVPLLCSGNQNIALTAKTGRLCRSLFAQAVFVLIGQRVSNSIFIIIILMFIP